MRSAGIILIILGLSLVALYFAAGQSVHFRCQRLAHWLFQWGPAVGWSVCGALVGLGVLMVALGKRRE